jgi:aminopeptidase N
VLLGLARRTTSTEERVRFYSALASARDRELAAATLPLALADATPNNLVGGLISSVAFAGEHPDLALGFVQANFSALTTRLGPPFRIYFVSNLMPAFPDRARARELENFAPVHETAGGRMVAARSIESIQADADFREESLPAIDRWVERHARQPKPD